MILPEFILVYSGYIQQVELTFFSIFLISDLSNIYACISFKFSLRKERFNSRETSEMI